MSLFQSSSPFSSQTPELPEDLHSDNKDVTDNRNAHPDANDTTGIQGDSNIPVAELESWSDALNELEDAVLPVLHTESRQIPEIIWNLRERIDSYLRG